MESVGVNDPQFVDRVKACTTSYELFQVARDFCSEKGFEHFTVARLPSSLQTKLRQTLFITSWPPEFIREYDDLDLLQGSPIFAKLKDTSAPFSWILDDIRNGRTDGKGNECASVFERFEIQSGACFPQSDSTGVRGTVTFSASRESFETRDFVSLNYFAVHIYHQIANRIESVVQRENPMTERETECVFWTARGKTSSEIAQILSISTNTVNHYLASASTKLGTSNKAHTVAKALTMRFLDI